MKTLIPYALFGGFAVFTALLRRHYLRGFSRRPCAGSAWRKAFPDAPKAQIREFLGIFCEAFDFPQKWRLHFTPQDRISDVYRTIYRFGGPDALECETLFLDLERHFHRSDFTGTPNRTLGEIFASVKP